MRNKFRLSAIVALLLALPITVASASSSSGNSGDRGKRSVEVIRVTEIIVQEAGIDLGEPGDSLGDQFVSSSDLFRAGEKVGIDGVVCTIVRLVPMVSATSQCVATAELPKGQITVQGLATFSEETEGEPFRLAITGGTGRYRTAHGEVIVQDVSETESRLTFKIIR
jgi:hypothetical protein